MCDTVMPARRLPGLASMEEQRYDHAAMMSLTADIEGEKK